MLTLTADADIISGMDILILDAIGANIFKNISTLGAVRNETLRFS